MISVVSASSDTNTTSISSDVSDTHITHTDTNTAIDKMNSDNNDNVINDKNKDPKIEDTRKSSTKDVESEKTDTRKLQSGTTKNEAKIKGTDETKSFTDLKNNITTSINNITLYDNYEFKDSDSKLKNGIIIDKIFTIYGNGKTINANNGSRIFNVTTTGSLTLINLTLINGNNEFAGAIYNKGNLTIINSTLKQNNVTTDGGAIYNRGNLTIVNSTLANNTAEYGGAIFHYEGVLNIINSTLANNTANNGYGGAISNVKGTLTIINTLLKNNNVIGKITYYADGGTIYIENGNTFIKNSTFINSTASNHGGAICINNGLLDIVDSHFINTTASNHGGVIYIAYGCMNITDSQFINSTAYSCGGAIAYENDADFDNISNIKRVQIINATSIDDAGGAIYLKHTIVNMDDVNITSSQAIFGGAITSLKTNLKINHINIINSTAEYYGGAIYQMYGNLSITNSNLLNTSAINGGAFYIVLNENLTITDNKFNNNHADNKGNVIYLFLNQTSLIWDNTYDNQINPRVNDLYETSDVSGFIGNGNYTLYHINYTELPETYPDYYDLRDYGYVTSVKDQNRGGNCGVFAALGALESVILKAGGESLDLSEENMKNLMKLYSIYGWDDETNMGGINSMIFGYLTSWLGPVYEYEDLYNDSSTLSLVLNSMTHIQNIQYITRNNATDNNGIKEALMRYGAVKASMIMDEPYLNNVSYYCYDGGNPDNVHAVLIVGWNDSYSKDNFNVEPEGNGAWIVKNSWGADWGDEGYFYISYYDTMFAIMNYPVTYAIILNDTIKYDRNYQYDIPGRTDYFINSSSTAWYKNVFNSTDNEYLAAVSTYFYEDTDWELTIKVNDIIKGIKTGSSQAGYYTINLNQMIPLNIGDIFEVIFKITVDRDYIEIPISEYLSTNVRFYKENNSFVSYDGLNWQDLYDLKWSYVGHNYNSQVACIKAFTILNPVNTQLSLDITNITEATVDLIATVYNEYGFLVDSGNVTFTIGDKEEIVAVKNGIAKLNTLITSQDVSAQFEATGYNHSTDTKIIDTLVPTKIELSKYPFISAYICDLEGKAINSGFVVFSDGFENYTVDVVNGFANLTDIILELGENQITATYKDLSDYYKSCNKTITIKLNKTSFRYLTQQIQEALSNNQNNITLNWDYKYDKETDYEYIKGITINNKFTIYGNNHTIDGNKEARIFIVTGDGDLTLENLTLVNGQGQNETFDGLDTNVGGAIYANNGTNVTITNCNFTNNLAKEPFSEGGAIYTRYNTTITITNSTFDDNTANRGGGAIFINTNSTLTINNITFNNNTAQSGGAITGNKKSIINISNSNFTNNTARDGGAIYAEGNSTITIKQSTFTGNTANFGGALLVEHPTAKITIDKSNFTDNVAYYEGGAIYALNSQMEISNSNFTNNTARDGDGGAIQSKSELNINNCKFTNNTARDGGAINAYNDTTIINNSIFIGNIANRDAGAIGIYTAGNIIINNSNFTDNKAKVKGGSISIEENSTTKINNTIFNNTIATMYGGAIYATIDLDVNNSILQNNKANKGTGIYIVNGTLTTVNTKFINNTVDGENYQVKHKDSQLKIETILDIAEGNTVTIKISADPLFNDNVTLNINGNNYNVKIINGKGQISIPNLKPGTYIAKLIFKGNDNYTEINVTSNSFKVNTKPVNPTPTPAPVGKQNTKILAKNKIYKPSKYRTYTVTVKNKKGKLVKNTRVKLQIGKKTYTSKTNSKGVATFKIPNKKSNKTKKSTKKSYKITATLNKNAKKDKLTLKMGTTYNTKTNNNGKGTFKVKTSKKKIRKYTITLKTTNGQAVKKQKVTLKVNKKTYKATTNNKGKATFKINNLNKKGKYKAKIQYKGNNQYNKSNKNVKITIKE